MSASPISGTPEGTNDSLPEEVNKSSTIFSETDADTDVRSNETVASLDKRFITKVDAVIPKKRQEVLKWYGWGYKDSEFYVKDSVVHFRGDKYPLQGYALPYFTDWVKSTFQVDIEFKMEMPNLPSVFPKPTENLPFLEGLKGHGISFSVDGIDRYIRCHGQTLHDIYYICRNKFKRIPDVVAWPVGHNEVEKLVAVASKYNIVVLPYGGGTSVSGAATCPQNEPRCICVVDTTQMNSMLWLNKQNLTVCFEAGIVGQDLERVLRKEGLTVGHEPDSYEFSTLGGWIATRASGMKKNVYGNIEDLVVSVKMVTPIGTLTRSCNAPRVSCGPDFNHVILGSEGTLGVITEVVLKVRPIPSVQRYGSLVFPDFESGVAFMREVARRRCQPASVRLMDNEQFILGQTMKPMKGWTGNLIDYLKKVYLTSVKRLQLNRICAVTLLFEGELKDIERQESVIYEIAKQYNGFSAGSENGKKGYILTFVIAYVRDIGIAFDVVAESFETSVPWDRCSALCQNVKNRVQIECRSHQIFYFIISCRVTQTYDAGACVYFYFAFRNPGFTNPVDLYEKIEASARDEILASGGSLSHHHGVGKIRNRWYKSIVTPVGAAVYKAIKRQLDPKNIFGFNNLLEEDLRSQNQMAKL